MKLYRVAMVLSDYPSLLTHDPHEEKYTFSPENAGYSAAKFYFKILIFNTCMHTQDQAVKASYS